MSVGREAADFLRTEAAKHSHPYDEMGYLIPGCHRCEEIRIEMTKAYGLPKRPEAKMMSVLAPHNHSLQTGEFYPDCLACQNEKTLKAAMQNQSNQGPQFIVKDTGKKEASSSGMLRNTADGKIDYTTVLDGPMFRRWAEHLTKAKAQYPDIAPGVANWTLAAGEEEYQRFRKSAIRHFIQWMDGETDEDHAAAVMFNINGKEYVEEKMKKKKVA